ncbi:hypothetical protein JQM83_05255 [Parabacteroides distasonis]|nr:hypothetical protein [Parabacteroides distasonis]
MGTIVLIQGFHETGKNMVALLERLVFDANSGCLVQNKFNDRSHLVEQRCKQTMDNPFPIGMIAQFKLFLQQLGIGNKPIGLSLLDRSDRIVVQVGDRFPCPLFPRQVATHEIGR